MICRKCKNQIPDGSIFCNWCGEKQLKERKKKEEIKVPTPRRLGSGRWTIQLRAEGQSVTEDTPELCIAKAKAIRAGFLQQEKHKPKLTLSDAIDQYIDSRRATVSPSTVQTYQKKKRLYFQELMNKDIYGLTEKMLRDAVNDLTTKPGAKGEKLSAKTVNDAYKFLVTVLQYHKINLDYKSVSLPQVQASPFAVLTADEQARLIKALPGNPCEVEILLALWLGLRRSEIMALEKKDFDFKHKTVTISKAVVRGENGDYVEKGTKTALSARVIACPDYILDRVKLRPEGKLYTYDANYILKCLHRVCQENGLPPVRLHDLRHINSSVGLLLGIPDKYVMERNGWKLKDTMVYRYTHTYSEEKKKADETFNDYFNGLLKEKIATADT